jgi:hypothetical protein
VSCKLGKVSVALVAFGMATPFFIHWKVGAGAPVVTTVKIAVMPATTVCDATGCVVMCGSATALTVSWAVLEVTLFVPLLTTTS